MDSIDRKVMDEDGHPDFILSRASELPCDIILGDNLALLDKRAES